MTFRQWLLIYTLTWIFVVMVVGQLVKLYVEITAS
jgi:hypothetical protein